MKIEEHLKIAKDLYDRCVKKSDEKLINEALNHCNEVINTSRDCAKAYYLRALIYDELYGVFDEKYDRKFEDLRKAISIYKEKINDCYNDSNLHLEIAKVYRKNYEDNGYVENAIKHLNIARELNPKCYEVFFALGEVYVGEGFDYSKQADCYNKAIDYYNKALDIKSDASEIYISRGDSLRELKKYELALSDYNKAIELDPNIYSYYRGRGEIYLKMEEWDKALSDYKIYKTFHNSEEKPRFKLLRNIKGGLYFELLLCDEIPSLGNTIHWSPSSWYIDESVICAFIDVFGEVKQRFHYYGFEYYDKNDLEKLLIGFKNYLVELDKIDTYEGFINKMGDTGVIYNLIREYNDFDKEWELILSNIKEMTSQIMEIVIKGMSEDKKLGLYGI